MDILEASAACRLAMSHTALFGAFPIASHGDGLDPVPAARVDQIVAGLRMQQSSFFRR